MIAINAQALAKSIKNLQAVRKKVEEDADKQYRQKAYYLLEVAVKVSPQYSGEFASNWNIVVDGDMPLFRPWPAKTAGGGVRVEAYQGADGAWTSRENPHQAGDPEAVGSALARGAAKLRGVTRHHRLHLVNMSDLHTDGENMIGPDGKVHLRPVNVIPGKVRIEAYVQARARELRSKK